MWQDPGGLSKSVPGQDDPMQAGRRAGRTTARTKWPRRGDQGRRVRSASTCFCGGEGLDHERRAVAAVGTGPAAKGGLTTGPGGARAQSTSDVWIWPSLLPRRLPGPLIPDRRGGAFPAAHIRNLQRGRTRCGCIRRRCGDRGTHTMGTSVRRPFPPLPVPPPPPHLPIRPYPNKAVRAKGKRWVSSRPARSDGSNGLGRGSTPDASKRGTANKAMARRDIARRHRRGAAGGLALNSGR